jgi:hypothetical protein
MSCHRQQSGRRCPDHDGLVLRDADRSLAGWLGRVLPPGIGLRFEAPDPQWAQRPPEPLFVDAFLHGVRQDARGRRSGWSDLRDADGRIVGRQPAAQYFRLSYLVTAWASGQDTDGGAGDRALAEHEVLGFVLDACGQHGVLPDDCLEGALAASGLQTVLECAPEDSAVAGALWSGLGIGPRACLELVLVAPARPPALTELAPPARELVLNASQQPTGTQAAAAGSPATERDRPFGTLRRWERTTIEETSAGQASRPDLGSAR